MLGTHLLAQARLCLLCLGHAMRHEGRLMAHGAIVLVGVRVGELLVVVRLFKHVGNRSSEFQINQTHCTARSERASERVMRVCAVNRPGQAAVAMPGGNGRWLGDYAVAMVEGVASNRLPRRPDATDERMEPAGSEGRRMDRRRVMSGCVYRAIVRDRNWPSWSASRGSGVSPM